MLPACVEGRRIHDDFDGFFRKAMGFLALAAIRRAHRRHIEAFKRFAETRALPMAT
jgi:hypothetical protein